VGGRKVRLLCMVQQYGKVLRASSGFAEGNSRVYVGLRWSLMICPREAHGQCVIAIARSGSTFPLSLATPSRTRHAFSTIACVACDLASSAVLESHPTCSRPDTVFKSGCSGRGNFLGSTLFFHKDHMLDEFGESAHAINKSCRRSHILQTSDRDAADLMSPLS
jgi:hypothetical protein